VRLRVDGVRVDLGGRVIVDGAEVVAEPGQVTGLIGPNGSGKSTLLRAVYRHLRPLVGAVHVGDDDVWTLTAREVARRVAAVPQETRAEFDIVVWDMVAMGRTPHKRLLSGARLDDEAIVAEALERVGAGHLAARHFATLSGGERQRVLVARALAQQTPVLVLDEPTNHLDIRHQHELLSLVRELGLTTLTALHDLNLAAAYCDHLHVLDAGRVVARGAPHEVLTAETLRAVFGVHAEVTTHDRTGRPHLVFFPLSSFTEMPERR
jgi:iron complex transport system ATP-binding protein